MLIYDYNKLWRGATILSNFELDTPTVSIQGEDASAYRIPIPPHESEEQLFVVVPLTSREIYAPTVPSLPKPVRIMTVEENLSLKFRNDVNDGAISLDGVVGYIQHRQARNPEGRHLVKDTAIAARRIFTEAIREQGGGCAGCNKLAG